MNLSHMVGETNDLKKLTLVVLGEKKKERNPESRVAEVTEQRVKRLQR